jgi:hypothetical protein
VNDDLGRRAYEQTLNRLAERDAHNSAADRARAALVELLRRRRTLGQVYMGGESDPTPGEIRAADTFIADLLDAGWTPPSSGDRP